ncbi:hypothetical protein LSH36_1204g01013 [Paralvinella palmiformis]|uniref:Uncharacterized protein n=1 Tax=Paralvinella palmiformis TaxID=53620 RepID=A0AAD9IUH4_9ANNE|nr:hypothetical protein LSH36_1204g01013 [Paralvinella palmiformis]
MLTKPDMWESEEFRRKFSRIPKSLQGEFLKAIQELYRQESQTMLQFIQMSRQSLRSAGVEIRDEQHALQATSKKLYEERRQAKGKVAQPRKLKSNAVVPQTHAGTRTAPNANTMNNQTSENEDIIEDDEQYFKEAKWTERLPRVMRRSELRNNLQICPRRDSNTGGGDLWSSTLPQDHGGDPKTGETEEIFRATSRAENVHANERARQMEKIEKKKKERRAKKDADKGKAEQLIREASNLEKQRSEEKKKQQDVVKEKLEKRRKKKSDVEKSALDEATDDIDVASVAPDPPTNEPDEEPTKKDRQKKKDKKKKKKKKREDNEEAEALPTDSPV